jgi:hypothetical protein
MTKQKLLWQRLLPTLIFMVVILCHALYMRYLAAMPTDGWADVGVGQGSLWGFDYYIQAQDYYMSFSYALGAAFAAWALIKFLDVRQAAMAAGAAGSLTLVGVLMGAGCFMIGCCGSPMLGIYAGMFGAKALGVGKPLMAFVTVLSVGFGYCYLNKRLARIGCSNSSCKCDLS